MVASWLAGGIGIGTAESQMKRLYPSVALVSRRVGVFSRMRGPASQRGRREHGRGTNLAGQGQFA
jgi:hypothetical protein